MPLPNKARLLSIVEDAVRESQWSLLHLSPRGEHPARTDKTCNGIALCALHHGAFDRAFVAFDPKFRVHVSESMATKLEEDDKAGGLANFRNALRPVLGLPPDRKDRPAPHFVEAANQFRGWQP